MRAERTVEVRRAAFGRPRDAAPAKRVAVRRRAMSTLGPAATPGEIRAFQHAVGNRWTQTLIQRTIDERDLPTGQTVYYDTDDPGKTAFDTVSAAEEHARAHRAEWRRTTTVTTGERPHEEIDTSRPLHERRPPELEKGIDQGFAHAQTPDVGYVSVGATPYGYGLGMTDVTTDDIVKSLLPERKSLRILDIGTGDARLLVKAEARFPGVVGVGISAQDFRRRDSPFPNERYVIGNAERLTGIGGAVQKGSFDLVCSAVTFRHFKDPLGSLELAYEMLTPGGFLVVDDFEAPGLAGRLGELMKAVAEQGYDVVWRVAPQNPASLSFIAIRKSKHEHLKLPVRFTERTKSEAVYSPTLKLDIDEKLEDTEQFRRSQGDTRGWILQLATAAAPSFYLYSKFRKSIPMEDRTNFLELAVLRDWREARASLENVEKLATMKVAVERSHNPSVEQLAKCGTLAEATGVWLDQYRKVKALGFRKWPDGKDIQ
ncbi:MAG TPA: class I SAM-dependent methyltransferase [Gaiellaceae bacterium]